MSMGTVTVTAMWGLGTALGSSGGVAVSPIGPTGATGPTGGTGAAGPNTVTGSTTTTLTGLLAGNGSSVSAVTTSAGLAAALSDETGSGAAVFGTTPVITTPIFQEGGGSPARQLRVSGDGSSIYIDITNLAGALVNNTIVLRSSTISLAVGGVMTYPGQFRVATVSLGAGVVDTILSRSAARVVNLSDGGTNGATLSSPPATPAQLTADANNYAPGAARIYRLSSDASRTITGLSVSQVSGQEFVIVNVGSNPIVLAHQSASSTAANRFICTGAADITLAADEVALGWYDATVNRWRIRKV